MHARRAMVSVPCILLLAGQAEDSVRRFLDDRNPSGVVKRLGYLSDEELDTGYVIAADVVALVHENDAPSGLLGKAAVSGTAVLAAGSPMIVAEVKRLHLGIASADTSPESLAAALAQLAGFASSPRLMRSNLADLLA